MISKIYQAILWFFGFREGETITNMLRRQKIRLGAWWYVLVGGTFAFLIWLVLHVFGIG